MVILALSVLNMEMMRFDSLRSGTSSEPSGFPVADLKEMGGRSPATHTRVRRRSVTADVKINPIFTVAGAITTHHRGPCEKKKKEEKITGIC